MVPDEKEAFQWLHPIRHLFHAMKDDLFYSSDGIIKHIEVTIPIFAM